MSGSDIARRDTVWEWVDVLPAVADLASKLAPTEFVPKALRGRSAPVAAAILTGAELGLGPMKSLASIDVVDGSPTLSAELMRGLVLAAGHRLRLVELTATRCVLSGQRIGDDEPTTVSWTMDDAKRAGLAGKRNWQGHPREMLLARATTLLCRTLFADVIGGLRSVEEVGDFADATAAVVAEPTEPRRVVQRRPRPQRQEVAAPERPAIEPAPVVVEDPPLDDEPEPVEEPVSAAQLKRIGAGMRSQGMTDRAEALAYVSSVVGRDIASRNELTKAEAGRLIEALEAPPLADPETGEVVEAEVVAGDEPEWTLS